MSKFIQKLASKLSLSKRKRILGVGVNDSNYITYTSNNRCPFYRKWVNMISRCYDPKYLEKEPTYKGCTVSTEWLLFSNFKNWMEKQDWENKQLDKDLKVPGNKLYASNTCLFISHALNSLLTSSNATRGAYLLGVSKSRSKFKASLTMYNKKKHIGVYLTAQLASNAYKKAKSKHIIQLANNESPKVKLALINQAKLIHENAQVQEQEQDIVDSL